MSIGQWVNQTQNHEDGLTEKQCLVHLQLSCNDSVNTKFEFTKFVNKTFPSTDDVSTLPVKFSEDVVLSGSYQQTRYLTLP